MGFPDVRRRRLRSLNVLSLILKLRIPIILMPGSITLEEMEEVVGILYNLDGSEKVPLFSSWFSFPPQKKMETAERAEILFNELEDDPDSGITEEEFIRWASKA